MHLRYDIIAAAVECKDPRHPQLVMHDLGIHWKHATPQSMSDEWWFWCCSGNTNNLPSYLSILEVDPMECVGFGLSQADALKIKAESTE